MAFLCNRGKIWENQQFLKVLRIIFRWRDSKVDFTLKIIHVTDDLEDIRFSRLWKKRVFTEYFKSFCTIYFFFYHMYIYFYLKHKGKSKRRPLQSVAWKSLVCPGYKSLSFRLTTSLVAEASSYVNYAYQQFL